MLLVVVMRMHMQHQQHVLHPIYVLGQGMTLVIQVTSTTKDCSHPSTSSSRGSYEMLHHTLSSLCNLTGTTFAQMLHHA